MNIVDFKLTYRCNNNCSLCCQDRRLRVLENDLSVRTVEKFFLKNTNCIDKAILTGGEPTLNVNALKIIKLLKEEYQIKHIQLQTNGKNLKNKELLDSFLKAGVNSFGISLHGHNKVIHEMFTSTPKSYEHTIEGLKNIKELNIPIALNCVVSKYNIDYLGELIKFVQDNDFADSLQFAFIHITGNAENKFDKVVRISYAADCIKKSIDQYSDGTIQVFTEAIPFCLMKGYEKKIAELYNNHSVITVDSIQTRDFTKSKKMN